MIHLFFIFFISIFSLQAKGEGKDVYFSVCINYNGYHDLELRGCGNDGIAVLETCIEPKIKEEILTPKNTEFIFLTDDPEYSEIVSTRYKEVEGWKDVTTTAKPTHDVIQGYLRSLASRDDVRRIFFQFSGHGTSFPTWYAINLQKEMICPLDVNEKGCIEDKWLRENFIDPMAKKSGHLGSTLLIDACYSGSSFNIPHRIYYEGKELRFLHDPYDFMKNPMNVVKLSGCMDTQTSADAYIWEAKERRGAMTNAFVKTYEEMKGICPSSPFTFLYSVHTKLKNEKYSQTPVLSSGFFLENEEKFDAEAKERFQKSLSPIFRVPETEEV